MLADAAEPMSRMRVNPTTFLAEGELPRITREGSNERVLARPNILMFNDYAWVSTRTDAQQVRMREFLSKLISRDARLLVVEIGAGLAVPTVRYQSERLASRFGNATLVRINPAEPQGPPGTISVPATGLRFLEELQAAAQQ